MHSPACRLLLLLSLTAVLDAQPSLDNARRAQALLAPDTWSRVLRIENQARFSPYPRTVHALIFEAAGLLWFYTDADGTQSFSLHRNNLAAEKADFAPLLFDIEPGFRRWQVLSEVAPAFSASEEPLLNGCFIESLRAFQQRQARGEKIADARLLSFYAKARQGRRGHTVLVYHAGNALEVYDPARPGHALVFEPSAAADPLTLARTLAGRDVVKARYLELDTPASLPIAAGPTPRPVHSS